MKILLTLSLLIGFSSLTLAADKNSCSSVTVTVCKDEKVIVVKKSHKKKRKIVKHQPLPQKVVIIEKEVVKEVTKKNTIMLYVHKAFMGLNNENDATTNSRSSTIYSTYNVTLGVQYIRHEFLDTPLAVGIGIDLQAMPTVSAGLDF